MKQFFGAFFGSILGIIIAVLLSVLILVAVVKSSISSAFNSDKADISLVKGKSVIKIVLSGKLYEREKENPFKELGDLGPLTAKEGLGLNSLAKKLKAAKIDEDVKGIYLSVKDMEAGFAGIEELRDLLADFKTSGKFIYCYSENYSQKEYYLASVASKVYLNPQGGMDWRGLGMNLLFFKNTLEKLEVDMQVFRHGKFKSAVEPFMYDKMSQSNRLQSETFLNSIWNTMLKGISKQRGMSVQQLNDLANSLSIRFPEDALKYKLVDATEYEDEVISQIKKKLGMKESEKMKFVELDKYEGKMDLKLNAEKIAVIYATGGISGGEGDDDEIGSDRLAKTIREARTNNKIKAIVLRVNSPGGSALASDVIWREMLLAKAAKPTIVSMGDYAASGGYYISCAADHIFAQPNTITGSIGVFGIIPNIQKMLQSKLGITVDTVNTNKYSDMGGLRPLTPVEYNFIQTSVEKVYDTFTKRVAEGRKMTQAEVDSIGQGRVWTGTDALSINLIDELGGLNDAIAYAAKKANLKDYKITELPLQKGPLDGLLGKKESELESRIMQNNLGPLYTYFKQVQSLLRLQGVQARMPFELMVN
ncbi:MAG: signal peptide peptidase SppA [bacterium]|nr:signal peptide peptidase SppA [bacterium]